MKDKTRPAINFRPLEPESERVFRSGQIVPPGESADLLQHFRKSQLGFRPSSLKEMGIQYVLNLRFDSRYQSSLKTFGTNAPALPLSEGEAIYSYPIEKRLIESYGIKSIYTPTLPEIEHFIGNYVPRLDKRSDSKPFICRLPKNMEDGLEQHWLNDVEKWQDQAEQFEKKGVLVPLASAFSDCHDLFEKYGKGKVETWVNEVKKTSHLENQILLQIADVIEDLEKNGNTLVYHCSSGTDRVGRLSMILEMRRLKITSDDLKAYMGIQSNSKIDLVVLNYLIAQRIGFEGEYRFLFPARKDVQTNWLKMALETQDKGIKIPAIESAKLSLHQKQ